MSRVFISGYLRILVVVLVAVAPVVVAAGPAYAATDITGDIGANRDVALSGDAVVNVSGTTTYTGVITGQGTLTVAGTGRLILTRDSDFTLPSARQKQKVTTGWSGDSYAVTTISDPDPPAVIVNRGATLQYGPGTGAAGTIGHYPYEMPGFRLNGLNIKVDGTLDVAVHKKINLGIISGSGFIIQRRNTWDGISMAGTHPFSGTLYNGTGMDLGSPYYTFAMPNVRKILNQGSAIVGSPSGHRHVLTQDFYSREYGNDMNFNFPLSKRALAVVTGVYSWADSGPDTDPALSDPSLNFKVVAHQNNKRGINIEGSNVQWGDGTHNRFFLPGNKDTIYINLHEKRGFRSRLTFDYNGPVTLGTYLSGGIYHDTLRAPGQGDIVIAGTKGNFMTFAAPQNYHGSTTIEAGATLRLGTGVAGGDSSLLIGTAQDMIVNNGALIVQNTQTAVTLSRVSGTGSFTQAGAATTTLAGQSSYTGATIVSAGTLALRSDTIASSSGVELANPGATLDLTDAGQQTIKELRGAAGSTVLLAANTLTVGTDNSTTFGGAVTGSGGGLAKVGAGTLTLTGKSGTDGGNWTVQQGVLQLGEAASPDATVRAAALNISAGATLSGLGGVEGALSNAGNVTTGLGATLEVTGDYTQTEGARLVLAAAGPGGYDRLAVTGAITLHGGLEVAQGALPDGAEQITVINNGGAGPISGTFDGLPEGATLTVDGTAYRISYAGGDGNDVVLATGAQGGLIGAFTSGLGGGSGGTPWAVVIAVVVLLLVLLIAVGVLLVHRRRRIGRRRRAG